MPWTYYASGSTTPGAMVGFADAGWNVGIALDQATAPAMRALERVRVDRPEIRLFVDSGAFGEFRGKPITDAEWRRRLAKATAITRAWGRRALVILPDKVGDQGATLERLERFRPEIAQLAQTGAELAIVVQRGSMPGAAFWREALRAARLPASRVAVAFPMKRAATPLREIEAFLTDVNAPRVHLLGLGPEGRPIKGERPSGRAIAQRLAARFPWVQWSWDSVVTRRMVGRKPRPRRLTAAQDRAREDIAEAAVGSHVAEIGGRVVDATEDRPSDWLPAIWVRRAWPADPEPVTRKRLASWRRGSMRADDRRRVENAQRAVALEIGITAAELSSWLSDPDAFVQVEDEDGLSRELWDSRFLPWGPAERLYQEAAVLITPEERLRQAVVTELRGEAPGDRPRAASEAEQAGQRCLPGIEW